MLDRDGMTAPGKTAQEVMSLRNAGFISAATAEEWFEEHVESWCRTIREIRLLEEVPWTISSVG